jgi:hypothetical protein
MIDKDDYWRKWCPFCNSPHIEMVALIHLDAVTRLNNRHRAKELQEFMPVAYVQCGNCQRVFLAQSARWAYDRKAMQRDYVRLGKLLAKGGD